MNAFVLNVALFSRYLKVKLDTRALYERDGAAPYEALQIKLADPGTPADAAAALRTLAWSLALRRLYTLVARCLAAGENVLLVGDTGCVVATNLSYTYGCMFVGGENPRTACAPSHCLSDRWLGWLGRTRGILYR